MSRGRWVALAAVVGVAALVGFLATREGPTLQEQAQQLHEVEPHELCCGWRLESWSRDGLVLEARYKGRGSAGWFKLRLWPTEAEAREWFDDSVAALAGKEELQQINTFAGLEYCARIGKGMRCVGWHENRSLVAETAHVDDLDLGALVLIRTARKHGS